MREPTPEELNTPLWSGWHPRPEKTDWPSWEDVQARYPDLCEEEQGWILENEIYEKLNQREQNEKDQTM